jgi:hypothetical protein
MTLDINLQITWTTIEPGTTRVDALWCRMLLPFTSERWALVQKNSWLAGEKCTDRVRRHAPLHKENRQKKQVRTARQKIRKGRHIRKAGTKEGRIANGLSVQCMFG